MSEQTTDTQVTETQNAGAAPEVKHTPDKKGKKDKKKDSSIDMSKERRSRKKVIGIILVLLLLLVIYRIATANNQEKAEEKMQVSVKASVTKVSDINVTTPLAGTIKAEDEANVVAMLQSNVSNVYVSVGDYVSKGTVLFTQDTSTLQGNIGSASAAISMAQESLASAKTNYERMAVMYNEGGVSQQQYEAAETQYKTAQASLAQAQSGMSSASAAVSNGTARAPISGYVTAVNVVAGAYPSGTPAVSIANTGTLKLDTNISEYLVSKIKVGDTVNVVVRSYSDEPFAGIIKTIAPAPSAGLTYPIEISLAGAPAEIKAGMFAEVNLISDSKKNVLCVPSDAVIIKNSQTKVVVLKDNVPEYVDVETGLDNGEFVEIISGLKEGTTVVTEGQHYIIEGEKVTIQK